jgi:hypothetical protein
MEFPFWEPELMAAQELTQKSSREKSVFSKGGLAGLGYGAGHLAAATPCLRFSGSSSGQISYPSLESVSFDNRRRS